MFSSTPNYTKLKTNLRLGLNRLKLLEKKKAELAQKARKEIADYLAAGKIERARIRVEHIIREDYLVEAMEIIEVYCDLLLARFGLVTQMKELDAGIAEAVSSIVWVCPRMQSDVAELKIISDIFIQKYGPQFAEKTRSATGDHNVSEKLMHKLQLQAPPKLLVEKYLIEIARNYQIDYEPDPHVMKDDQKPENHLIDLSDRNNLGGAGAAPPQLGFIDYPSVPPLPQPPTNNAFNYPPPYGGGGGSNATQNTRPYASGMNPSAPFAFNIPPNVQNDSSNEKKDLNISSNFIHGEASRSNNNGSPDENFLSTRANNHNSHQRISPPPRYSSINPYNSQKSNKPKPQPRGKMPFPSGENVNVTPSYPGIPDLPNVPSDLPDIPSDEPKKPDVDDDIDFDDLSRRFQELKKKK